jgi:hypothetical protein
MKSNTKQQKKRGKKKELFYYFQMCWSLALGFVSREKRGEWQYWVMLSKKNQETKTNGKPLMGRFPISSLYREKIRFVYIKMAILGCTQTNNILSNIDQTIF